LLAGLSAVALAAIAAPASAGGASCVIATTPLAFGRYVPSRNAPADFTATLELHCTATGEASASIDGAIGLVGGNSERQLSDGPRRLRYRLYADPARTIPWTDGAGARKVSGTVSPAMPLRVRFTVYGRILARQRHAQVGHYSDQVTAVLTY
jgi:spore coat protein U-like protein